MARFPRLTAAACGLALLSVVGFSTAGGTDAPTTETVQGELSVLSYNVAGLPEALSGSDPSENMPLIGPLLDAYDLVLTQEDFANPDPPIEGAHVYHDVLRATTDFPHVSDPQTPPMGTNPDRPDALLGDGLSFFSRISLGPVDRVTWDDCMGVASHSSDCLATKGFAMTTIELGPGATVDVYDLHADAGGAIEDQQTRASNFAQLAAYITTRSAGHAVILGGDTNLHTDRSDRPEDARVWQEFLENTGLVDVCDTMDCGDDSDEIDKFAYRSAGDVELAATSHVFERERFARDDGEPLSDHDPVHVGFAYTATITPSTSAPATTAPATTREVEPSPARPAAPARPVPHAPSYTG